MSMSGFTRQPWAAVGILAGVLSATPAGAVSLQDLVSGGEGFAYLEGIDFVQPRRYFVGARLRF